MQVVDRTIWSVETKLREGPQRVDLRRSRVTGRRPAAFGHEGTVDGTANIVHNFSSHIRQSRLSKDQSS